MDVYGNVGEDGIRITRQAILSIARKNGKTALIAALALVHICGPEAGINEEIASAANDKDQAAMVYKYICQIIRLSPKMDRELTTVDSRKRVVYHGRGNVYQALSSEAGTKHGMNPAVVIYDELAQSKNTELFDALETSQGAQPEPLFFVISTQSHDPQHPLSQMIDDALLDEDDSLVVHLYEVPEEIEDVFEEVCWASANPALGDFRSLVELRKYAARAKRLPSKENVLRNLYLNQRVSLDATLFARSVWMACAGEVSFDERESVFLALDFAQTTDLCALAVIGDDMPKLECFFWKPEELMEEHGKRDRRDYRLWLKQGFMEPCPGKTINPDLVARKIVEMHRTLDVRGLIYDRWRIDWIIKALEREGVEADRDEDAELRIIEWGQGYRDMAPAIDALEEEVIEERLVHCNSPVLNWNIANAIVTQDAAGNRKLDKSKTRMRIDGAQAVAMAAGGRARFREEPLDSIYRTMKPMVL